MPIHRCCSVDSTFAPSERTSSLSDVTPLSRSESETDFNYWPSDASEENVDGLDFDSCFHHHHEEEEERCFDDGLDSLTDCVSFSNPNKRFADVFVGEEEMSAESMFPIRKRRITNEFQRRSGMSFKSAPKAVEYQCSVCAESYEGSTEFNPWWALSQEKCPKCHKLQIPKIDIALPQNMIEYHPALLAEDGEDESDEDEEVEGLSFREAEESDIAFEVEESALSTSQASKLLVLMSHARTCPGFHKNRKAAEICRATKFMMLHVRDCDGKLVDGSECDFSWCRPCKQLLTHLIRYVNTSLVATTCRLSVIDGMSYVNQSGATRPSTARSATPRTSPMPWMS